MTVLRIEHPVSDYDAWKTLFDGDPADRRGSGVQEYRIFRPIDDMAYVAIELDFSSTAEAEAMLAKLQGVWDNALASGAVTRQPSGRILEMVEVGTP